MKPRYRYLIAIAALGILAAILVWKYTFKKSELSVKSHKADVEIAASALQQAFETNENNANTLYLDKIIIVTGTVESVSEDSVGISVYLKDKDALSGVICSFDKTSNDLSTVAKGSAVKVKGICTGYLMDVVMNRCSLE